LDTSAGFGKRASMRFSSRTPSIVREVIQRAKRREVRLITSVLTSVEVLAAKLPVGLETLFYGLMKRLNRVGMDSKCAGLAHDLRNYYVSKASEYGGKTVSTPDAIHLATAVHYRADEFHTFDHDGGSKSLGLLPLSGDVGATGSRYAYEGHQTRRPESVQAFHRQAREIGADEDKSAADELLGQLAKSRTNREKQTRGTNRCTKAHLKAVSVPSLGQRTNTQREKRRRSFPRRGPTRTKESHAGTRLKPPPRTQEVAISP
jgi:predicted nucleic acid-binding protein